MRRFLGVLLCALSCVLAIAGLAARTFPDGAARTFTVREVTAEYPSWAYGFTTPPPPGATAAPRGPAGGAPPPSDPTLHSLAGTNLRFTRAQISNRFGPADWYPGDHPKMPDIVARGRAEADLFACGLCHMPNGKGRPENSAVSGLPEEYFIQTLMDFRRDLRRSADPRKNNTNLMVDFAKAMTEDEIKASAAYFSSMPWTPWIRVVETSMVPKTRIQGGMFLRLEGNGTEPIGNRIIEAPEDTERTELLRDPRSGFIAYVPVGSVKRGETLVKTGGNGKTVQCAVCHGAELQGMGPVPGLAGRSPSYVVRQLYDMQVGTRKGLWSELMTPVVANLTAEDFVAIAAYTASRPVQATKSTTTN